MPRKKIRANTGVGELSTINISEQGPGGGWGKNMRGYFY
jgi:hypothetical protein